MKGHAVLVSDFDGTITSNDFYQLVMEQYMDCVNWRPSGSWGLICVGSASGRARDIFS
jgi:hypothetical protein